MRLSSLVFQLYEGYLNIRRNGLLSLAALSSVTVALLVLGASLWTGERIREIVAQKPQTFNEIDVFLRTDAGRPAALALAAQLRTMPSVETVLLVPRERAWAVYKQNEPSLAGAMDSNPLPDKLEVQMRDPKRVSAVAASLLSHASHPEVAHVNYAGAEIRMMLGLAHLVNLLGAVIALALFAATLIQVQTAIRFTVLARRREIRIMQLVGATNGFIRLPLLLEGVFYGGMGGAIAAALLVFCAREVAQFVTQLHSPLLAAPQSAIGPLQVVFGLITIGVATGLSGAYVSLRRFLKTV